MLDRLIAKELQAHFPCGTIGQRIIVLEQTGSTNDAILHVAWPQGAAVSSPPSRTNEGLVLFAEHQTSGRGQRGNRWESAVGKGLWFEAIADVIRTEFALEPTIKLPNDVQLYGRKVAGVLVEMRAQEKAPHLAIVGVGINVNQSLEDFPPELRNRAISLAMALQRPVDRQKFAVVLLRNLDRTYRARFAPKS